MKKLRIVGLILLVFLGAALVAPWFIPADAYKDLLTAQVKKALGRDLVISGATSFSILPSLALQVENVRLSNPDGYHDADMAQIGRLSVQVALKPLLSKKLEIKGITLDKAVISLEQKADGSNNWTLAPKSESNQTSQTNSHKPSSRSPLSQLVLGNVQIKDSDVTFRKAGAKTQHLEHINLTVSSRGYDAPLSLDANLYYQAEKIAANISLDNLKAFTNGQLTPAQLSIALPSAQVSYKGKSSIDTGFHAKGDIALSIADLQKLTSWATGKPSTLKAPKSITLTTALSMEGDKARFANIALGVDSLAVKGDLTASMQQKIPQISGALDLGALDIDALLPPKASTDASKPTADTAANNSADWSAAPIDLSALNKAQLNLLIKADSVTSGKIQLGATSFAVLLENGVLRVQDIATKLYEGTATGALSMSASGALSSTMKLQAVAIESLMKALSGSSRIAGTATANVTLNASGKSMRAWVQTLAGKGDIFVRDGAILGINIGKFLRDAKQGFILSDNTTERTDFAELSASFTANAGVISNQDLALKAPALRLQGAGTVSLPPKTIQYKLTPKITATAAGQGGKDDKMGIAIPLLITGPWSHIAITPDLAGALQEGLNNPDAALGNVKAVKDAVGDLNSPKDLKKALGGFLGKQAPTNDSATTATQPAQEQTAPAQDIKQGIGNLIKGF